MISWCELWSSGSVTLKVFGTTCGGVSGFSLPAYQCQSRVPSPHGFTSSVNPATLSRCHQVRASSRSQQVTLEFSADGEGTQRVFTFGHSADGSLSTRLTDWHKQFVQHKQFAVWADKSSALAFEPAELIITCY